MSSEDEPDQLDQLDQKIDELKGPRKDQSELARGLSLVFSLGFTVGGTLYLGYLGGVWLKRELHSELAPLPVMLVALGMAGLGAYKLLLPWLRK